MIAGPSGDVPVTGIALESGNTYRISFSTLAVRGNYDAVIGPDITDVTGNQMDQNQNGTNGEADDTYTASLAYIDADTIFNSVLTITEADSSYDGQDILIDGTTVAINGPHRFNSVHLVNGGMLTHSANTAAETHKLDITVTEQVIVDATSRIDVSDKGYLGRHTSGNTMDGGVLDAAGGSYGGLGGRRYAGYPFFGFYGTPNRPYGDYAYPEDWGSGGGGSGPQNTDGGVGGGRVWLQANELVLEGALKANGEESNYGGGSGGGILVEVNVLRGTGVIEAAGGGGTNPAKAQRSTISHRFSRPAATTPPLSTT